MHVHVADVHHQIDKATVQQMRTTATNYRSKPKHIVVTKEDIESFFRAQQQVADWLQYKHYRSFLLSDYYRSYVPRVAIISLFNGFSATSATPRRPKKPTPSCRACRKCCQVRSCGSRAD